MFLVNKRFLRPTKEARIVSILENLAVRSEISQSELGERALLSSAMINNYLKELQQRGLIEACPLDGKRYEYRITADGERIRRELLGLYMAEIVQVYSGLKENIREKLQRIGEGGIKEIIFFGASTTCEVVLSAYKRDFFRIIALVDSDPVKQGRALMGYIISPPEILRYIRCRNILVTSFAREEEIRDYILNELTLKDVKIFTL